MRRRGDLGNNGYNILTFRKRTGLHRRRLVFVHASQSFIGVTTDFSFALRLLALDPLRGRGWSSVIVLLTRVSRRHLVGGGGQCSPASGHCSRLHRSRRCRMSCWLPPLALSRVRPAGGISNPAISVYAETVVMCNCVQARQEVLLIHVACGVADGCIGVWGRFPDACILARCGVASRCDPSDFLPAISLIEPHA